MTAPLRDRCRHRWPELLRRFGIDSKFLVNRHGPCPICAGTDRFRFDNDKGEGTWICNQCGAGDGVKLLMLTKGWSFKEAADEIEKIVGTVKPQAAPRRPSDDWMKRLKNDLWSAGQSVDAADPVGKYLSSRGLSLSDYPRVLRFVEKCRYDERDGAKVKPAATFHPAMIARFDGPDGKPSTIHRTYLTHDGSKADLPKPRLLMPGDIAKGGAVRLAPAGPVMGIAEGIETALSAAKLWRVPCWAALNAGAMIQWEPPEGTESVLVFADNDSNFTGQEAGFMLAKRLKIARGLIVTVEFPPDVDTDWNDALRGDAA